MSIEGERLLDVLAFHYHKGHAVRQRVAFVSVVSEIAPGLREYRLIDMHERDKTAVEQRFPDCDCLGVMPVAVEKRRNFVEHLGSGYERHSPFANFTPSVDRCSMMLVICRFQRDQKPGVEKVSRHDPPYKWAS